MTTGVAGLAPVLRLNLRRERTALLAWVIGLGLLVASTFPAIKSLYPDASGRATLAAGIGANPAFVAVTGPIGADSVAGLGSWRIGVLACTATALMALLTVIRRTRAEETGRAELLAATSLGRQAPLLAALLTATAAAVGIGVLATASALGSGTPIAGALDLGAAIAGSGLVFAGVAAVTAQLTASARTATGLAGATLGLFFLIRAAADTLPGAGGLRWFSPLGWITEVGPFAADRAWVLVLYPLLALILVVVAAGLRRRRDLGVGLWVARPGPARGTLGSPPALIGRLWRGSVIGWAVGLVVAGAIIGAVSADTGTLLADNPRMEQYFRDIGGAGDLTSVLLGTMAGIAALAVTGQGIAYVNRWDAEETSGRLGALLAAPIQRRRWLAAALGWALLAPAGSLLLGGVAAGLTLRATGGGDLGSAVLAMAVQIPAVWVLVGLAVALLGWWRGGLGVAWGTLGAALLLGQIGALLKLPQAVLDVSPFTHVPSSAHVTALPLLVLIGVAAVLVGLGVLGYARRDILG